MLKIKGSQSEMVLVESLFLWTVSRTGANEVAHGGIGRTIFAIGWYHKGSVKAKRAWTNTFICIVRPTSRTLQLNSTRKRIILNRFKSSSSARDIPYRIPLHLPQLPAGVRGTGDADGGAIVLRVALGAVTSQKQSPQIRDSSAKQREQFRVGSRQAANALFSLKIKAKTGI